MAFNWFRRQFAQPENVPNSQTEPKTEPETKGTDAEASPVSTEEEIGAEEAVKMDRLAWAKAAYQTIQQRQQATDPTAEPTLSESTAQAPDLSEVSSDLELPLPPEEIAEDSNDSPTDTEQVVDRAEDTGQVRDPQVEDRPESQGSAPAISEAIELDPGVDRVGEESNAALPAALPIWARADAERQARLERLKATALEEDILASSTPTTPAASDLQPGVSISSAEVETEIAPELDEGFLWSAEVLAAQGRQPEEISADEITWLQKLRQGLGKTRRGVVNQLKTIVGKGPLTQESVLEIEALLLQADVGIGATDTIIEALQQKMLQETLPPDEAIAYLKKILRDILDAPLRSNYSSTFTPQKDTLNIWLMTGVNGAGKTTTIGKLVHVAKESGYICLVAAADTFRAAAVEQVKVWAGRSGVDVIANPGQNTDPAAVVFDAIAAAQSRNIELLLVDTAGRLQNKKNLMDELRKVRQVIDKKAPHAKVESLLVLDATLGQNGLRQAQVFSEAAQLSGVVLTKLDGTAKGGVALAVVQQLGLPIRFIGAGEGIEDLRPFSSYEFVEALLSN
jgi:fused signal recognition particle receptor